MSSDTIIRVSKTERYAIIDKQFLDEDARLTWKAKGLLTYFLAKPDGWQIRRSDLIKRSADGKDSVSAGLKELEQFGYLERKMVRQGGKFGYENIIHERPEILDIKPFPPGRKIRSGSTVAEKPLRKIRRVLNNNNNKYKDQQQRSISDLTSIADQSNHEKSVVVDSTNQLDSIKKIMAYAKGKGIEVFEDCARDFLDAAASSERAKKAVDWAAEVASSKVRRGERVRNPAGLLFKGLHINSGAKLDPESLDSERKKRLAEKEDRYRELYLS